MKLHFNPSVELSLYHKQLIQLLEPLYGLEKMVTTGAELLETMLTKI